jgi:signal transduction histidine kinase
MMAMKAEWLIVLNADGTVLAVDGGAPLEWLDTRVQERADVPADVRRAADEARRQCDASSPDGNLVSTTVTSAAPAVRILALHAIPVRRRATDLRALLESTVRVMEQQARAIEVALALDVGSDVPRTLCLDPEKIAWTLTALIGNALRFVRRGTRLMPGGAIQVRARYAPAASQVILEVQDDGSGIPKETLTRLLRRSPGPPPPSGLALSLMQDVIAAHGGSVQLESSTEPDHSGTTVRLVIPSR